MKKVRPYTVTGWPTAMSAGDSRLPSSSLVIWCRLTNTPYVYKVNVNSQHSFPMVATPGTAGSLLHQAKNCQGESMTCSALSPLSTYQPPGITFKVMATKHVKSQLPDCLACMAGVPHCKLWLPDLDLQSEPNLC